MCSDFSYRFTTILIFSLSTFSCSSPTQNNSGNLKIIYGQDDRVELYAVQNKALREVARSTVALVRDYNLNLSGDQYSYRHVSLREDSSVCNSEPFADQPTIASCSGALIGEDTVLTAGHCIETSYDCEKTSFVFDYALQSSDQPAPSSFSKENVFHCASIVHSVVTKRRADFAIVKLDRPVTNRKPIPYRVSGKPEVGDDLTIIGYPLGLPLKIADSAKILSMRTNVILASVDSYTGNSGSPVINSKTNAIEGLLVRGDNDFKNKGKCAVSLRCNSNKCAGEELTSMDAVTDILSGRKPANGRDLGPAVVK